MPLAQTKVIVPLTNGLSLKVGKRDAQIGSMLSLENAVMQNPGELEKRPGWQALSRFTTDGDSLASGANVAQLGTELFCFDGSTAFSYLNPTVGWVPKGTFYGAIGTDVQVVRNRYQQSMPTAAYSNGYIGYSYIDSRGGNRATVVSSDTGTVVVSDVSIDGTTAYARAVSYAGNIMFIYTEGGDVLYVSSPGARPTLLNSVVTAFQLVFTDADDHFFDTCVGTDGNLYISYSTVSGGTYVAWFDSTLAAHGPYNVASAGSQVEAIMSTSTGLLWVAIVTAGVQTLLTIPLHTANPSATTYNFLSQPSPSTTWNSVTMIEQPSTPGRLTLFYEVLGSIGTSLPTSYIMTAQASPTVTPSMSPWMQGVNLASKPFVQAGDPMVCVQYRSLYQPCLYVVTADADHDVVAKDRYEALGQGIGDGGVLPDVVSLGTDQWLIPLLDGGVGIASQNVLPGQAGPGVGAYQLSFDTSEGFDTATVDSYSVVATGAGLKVYDGSQFTEDNFYCYPEQVQAVAGSDGNLSAGGYTYAATYAWTDNQGGVVRSSVSVVTDVTSSLSGSVSLTVPALTITDRNVEDVIVEIWRSQVNPSFTTTYPSMNLVTQLQNAPQIGYLAPTLTYTDTASDASIAGNELLYTAGGTILDYAPASPGSVVSTYDNRIWVGGLASAPNSLEFSNQHVPGQPIQFNAYNVYTLDSLGGTTVTALGNMNQELIIFKPASCYCLLGTGPDPTGANSTYKADLISSDAGCTEPRSIVLQGTLGLLFKSAKGIYMVDGGSNVGYKGADVEAFNGFPVTGAVLCSQYNQVRFTLDSSSESPGLLNTGIMLVWDYFTDQWLSFTGLDAAGSCLYNGTHTLIKDDGEVWQESAASANYYVDPYGFYGLSFELNEIQPFGQQGQFIAYDLFLLGSYVGPHTVEMAFAFDGAPWDSQVSDVNAQTTFGPPTQATYGFGGGVYGTTTTGSFGAVYGGVYAPYQLRFSANRYTNSIRVRVTETQTPGDDPNSGGLVVQSLLLNCADLGRGPFLAPQYQS